MKTAIQKLLLLTAACILPACSSVTVTTDYDRAAPFGSYKTYSLAPAAQGQAISPTSEAALSDSLRSRLAARGITEAQAGVPDLVVARHFFLRDKTAVRQYTDIGYGAAAWPYGSGYRYGHGYYGMWTGAPRVYTDVTHYTQGTMVLDFVDSRTNKLVFRGTGEAVAGDSADNARKIQEAVSQIVAKFPAAGSQ